MSEIRIGLVSNSLYDYANMEHEIWDCFIGWRRSIQHGLYSAIVCVQENQIQCIALKIIRTEVQLGIPKTCLYNFDPLKPHCYIVKLGFTGVYIIFLISAQNIDCGYSLEPTQRGGSNEYPQSMFLSRNMKNIRLFYLKIFIFWW